MFVNTNIIKRHNDDCNVKFLKNKWSVPGFQLLSPLPEWNRVFIETFRTLKHLVYITWAVWLDDINFSLKDPLNILGHILDCLRTFGTLLGISADTIRFFSAKWVEQNRDFSLKFQVAVWALAIWGCNFTKKGFSLYKISLNFLKKRTVILALWWND